MADPLAPTVPERPPIEAGRDERPAGAVSRVALGAVDDVDPIARELVRARAETGLFGEAAPVTIGRYRVIERVGAGGMGVVWSAWDPELGRGVALKLASSGSAQARAQVLDEGRALAKLSHPHVVPIYDVLDAPEGVFLVMELVRGRTLRVFAIDAEIPALIGAYRQAGEGLAAAHEAGLIHRDFKADNAVIGADHRVRVLDFGLAHTVADEMLPAIAGTPRYMAPEQLQGLALTAAVDQYGLCVALEEAVRARGAIPAWLAPILTRGSAPRAQDRFDSMAELVRALALTPAARWRKRVMIAGSTIAVGALVSAFALGRARREDPPCEIGAALLAQTWSPELHTRAVGHLTALHGGYAREAVPRIVGTLDDYAASWVRGQRDACMAHQTGAISSAMLDRRTACLARRKGSLATLGELAISARAEDVPGMVVAAGSLPDLVACGDDDALLSPVPAPAAARADEAAALADKIARVDVERDAGRISDATADANAAVTEARALAYEPLIARALVARGRIGLSLVGMERGTADFVEATQLALAMGDDPLAIEAFARAAYAIATTSTLPATEGLPLIEAITRRAGNRAAFARALLHHNIGAVALAHGERAAARTAFEQARREAKGQTGSAEIELTSVLFSLMIVLDDPTERDRIGAELVAMRVAILGANHPLTLEAQIARASLSGDPRGVRAAMTPACTAMATLHPDQRPLIRECAYDLAWRSLVADDRSAAAAMASRVIDAAEATSSDSRVLRARAFLMIATGDAEGAAHVLTEIAPIGPSEPWWQRLTSIDVALGLALAERARHQQVASMRALDLAERLSRELAALAPIEIADRLDAISTLRAR